MTPEEADKAYDDAPAIPISDSEIDRLVEAVTSPKCGLCGQPMPPGEEMFQYHGFSGPCPESA